MKTKIRAYLFLIGETNDASVVLTKGYTKQADELKNLGLATYIPISTGGCLVALTELGIQEYEKQRTES